MEGLLGRNREGGRKGKRERERERGGRQEKVAGRRTTLFANYSASAHLHPRSRQPSAGGVNLLIKRNCLQ